MISYIARRLLLMIPTLFGIVLITFVVLQLVPGGPVERMIAQLRASQRSGANPGVGDPHDVLVITRLATYPSASRAGSAGGFAQHAILEIVVAEQLTRGSPHFARKVAVAIMK